MLLLVYLVANYTVFEYYGGNPELGIISYNQASSQSVSAKNNSITPSAYTPLSKEQGDDQSAQLDGDDCLASCTHSLQVAAFFETRAVSVAEPTQNQNIKLLQPDPHLPTFYRPPRTA